MSKELVEDKWFDMIERGEKKEEYRAINPYWSERLYRLHQYVVLHRGYTRETMTFKIDSITAGYGNPDWGAPITRTVYIIRLGRRFLP